MAFRVVRGVVGRSVSAAFSSSSVKASSTFRTALRVGFNARLQRSPSLAFNTQRFLWGGSKDDSDSNNGGNTTTSKNLVMDTNKCTISIPLPRGDVAEFPAGPALTVGDFIKNIKKEDPKLSDVELFNYEGDKITHSMIMGTFLPTGFQIMLNKDPNCVYIVEEVNAGAFSLFQMGIKDVVDKSQAQLKADLMQEMSGKLETLLNQYHNQNEKKSSTTLESMVRELYTVQQEQAIKAEQSKQMQARVGELEALALEREEKIVAPYIQSLWVKHDLYSFVGLGVATMIWAGFARATFEIYSWDFMEPVTYFYTFGVQNMFMMYYILFRHEFEYNSFERWSSNNGKKAKLLDGDGDLQALKQEITELKEKI